MGTTIRDLEELINEALQERSISKTKEKIEKSLQKYSPKIEFNVEKDNDILFLDTHSNILLKNFKKEINLNIQNLRFIFKKELCLKNVFNNDIFSLNDELNYNCSYKLDKILAYFDIGYYYSLNLNKMCFEKKISNNNKYFKKCKLGMFIKFEEDTDFSKIISSRTPKLNLFENTLSNYDFDMFDLNLFKDTFINCINKNIEFKNKLIDDLLFYEGSEEIIKILSSNDMLTEENKLKLLNMDFFNTLVEKFYPKEILWKNMKKHILFLYFLIDFYKKSYIIINERKEE